jgi:glycine/sarcosine N-methyltransferase
MSHENLDESFYNKLASIYHLIFEDWDISMKEQGKILSRLIPPLDIASPILDCACGIGTQSIGLASLGYQVEGSDLSNSEIIRAEKEASLRGLLINFRVDDMRQLKTAPLS